MQNKPFHHNKTGRVFGEDARGLAGLPWVTAEDLEGYFSGQEVPPEKCGV